MTLGTLDELSNENERKALADRIEELVNSCLFTIPLHGNETIEKLAQNFYRQLIDKNLKDKPRQIIPSTEKRTEKPDIQSVDLNSLEHEDGREIGAEWMCYQAIEQLELRKILIEQDWDESQIKRGLIHLISRCVFPASEHKTERWIKLNSGVNELFSLGSDDISRYHLYKSALKFYNDKEAVENGLSIRTNELFDLDDKIILYDLTNTYFEGRKVLSEICWFGKSKEKRNDAKLVVLALVVNVEGFVKHSRIFSGNMSDCKTLQKTIEELSEKTSFNERKPLIVIDAGIATSDNLKMLRGAGYDYLCVSREKLKDYNVELQTKVQIYDKRKHPIDLYKFEDTDSGDNFLYVRSEQKACKELSMKEYYTSNFEIGLEQIKQGLEKKGGTKKLEKVWERIGRLKQKYQSANRFYHVEVKSDGKGIAAQIIWRKKIADTEKNEGIYFLRTTLKNIDETRFWNIYNTIRQIEAVFRFLKTDLKLRPVFHQGDISTIAHLHLGILAYQVINTIRHQLKNKDIHHDWKNIVRIMNSHKMVTSTINKEDGKRIVIRKCSLPKNEVRQIYDALKYKYRPFIKKSVLPENEIFKTYKIDS
ncbi:MAG: IS1634 family transposase [Bacteroidia bacterium]|nr:IS1634 family transposase [Bacteroidia bacterium]